MFVIVLLLWWSSHRYGHGRNQGRLLIKNSVFRINGLVMVISLRFLVTLVCGAGVCTGSFYLLVLDNLVFVIIVTMGEKYAEVS